MNDHDETTSPGAFGDTEGFGVTGLEESLPEPRSNILIVDDLQENLLVHGTVLEDLQQNLIFVKSGADALREVLQRDFAVILLDVNMPDIDGFETAGLIRKYRKSAHTPIIFLTSYADEMQTVRGYSLGAVDFIMSPVVPEVLRTKVKVFVDLHTMQQRVRRQGDERGARMAAESARRVAEANDQRSHFLARASSALGASLDPTLGERALIGLLLPEMAEFALFLRAEPDERLGDGLVGSLASDSVQLDDVRARDVPPALRDVLGACLEAAAPVVLDAAALASLNAAGALRRGAAPLTRATAVPLRSARRRIGALLVAGDRHEADGTPPSWSALPELAARAAIAFENAQLYRSLQAENAVRTAAEAQLQEVNRRKDEFLAMLSHELRNPLAPIRNALEIIRRVGPQHPKLVWATDVMGRQVQQMTRLIDELLDVARISEGKITLARAPVDLRAVLEASVETVQALIAGQRTDLRLSLPDEPVWLQGDFARLTQVVGNLLHNAAKYSNDAGTIELTLAVERGEALICVRDNGIGIEAALLPRIFDLFTQGQRSLDRSQGGLGVGLTLVRRLVELHGGRVEAQSAGAGTGAEFRVRIPVISAVPQPAGDKAPREASPSRGQRVLIVDDNLDAAETVAQYLELDGHEVKTAADGMQALACMPVFAPQVLLLDIGLPGLSGYEVARRVREMHPGADLLLIAVTGYGQHEDRVLADEAGFDHHLLKPADPRALFDLIAAWALKTAPGAAADTGLPRIEQKSVGSPRSS